MKCRNFKFGYMEIALQITHAFGLDIDNEKDVARWVVAKNNRPGGSGFSGRSWLRLSLHPKKVYGAAYVFRRESVLLYSP